MGCHTQLGALMHVMGTYLNLKRPSLRIQEHCMQRLIAIGFWPRNVVIKLRIKRLPVIV